MFSEFRIPHSNPSRFQTTKLFTQALQPRRTACLVSKNWISKLQIARQSSLFTHSTVKGFLSGLQRPEAGVEHQVHGVVRLFPTCRELADALGWFFTALCRRELPLQRFWTYAPGHSKFVKLTTVRQLCQPLKTTPGAQSSSSWPPVRELESRFCSRYAVVQQPESC